MKMDLAEAGGTPVTPRHDFSPEEIDALEDRIAEYNGERTGYYDARRIGFEVRRGVRLVGAVAGYTWGGICELRQLWVEQPFRMSGFGTRLLTIAIDEARARGCQYVYLATHSFQAPDFYAKFGFETVAAITDMPLGHRSFILSLRLTEPGWSPPSKQ
jgi:N-acetylglutamate synthase-like GNAT family acetyltransferase